MQSAKAKLGLVLSIALVAILLPAEGQTARHNLRRAPRIKPELTRVYPGLIEGQVTLKFRDDQGIYLQSGRLYFADGQPVTAVNDLIEQGRVERVEPGFDFDKSTLMDWRRTGEANAQTALADLSAYFRLKLTADQTVTQAAAIADLLNLSPDVELAFLEGKPEVAGDITPVTPDYEPTQDYLSPAPGGVDAYAAWGYPGGDGTGVKICDIEYGWQEQHEDLSKLLGGHIGGDYGADNHGTAVMGEMLADSTISALSGVGYGVTGISYGAVGRMVSVAPRSTADALLLAAANLDVGDLILIELHQSGPNSTGSGQFGYVPMEWTPAIFDVIQLITANGIIVCEAAGNGSQNLSDPVYGGWFDTTIQHSGAIMCGAGAPPSGVYGPDRSRLSFSNYGMRVDLQGYGNGVVTTGYGGVLLPLGDTLQTYTATFSGTSSASPIVTASVACVQGRFKNISGGYTLSAKEIRDLLYATGSLQTGATSEHIGPRPNLGAAMPLVVPQSAYPNPRTLNYTDVSLLEVGQATDTMWLVNPHGSPTNFTVTIVDSVPTVITGAPAALPSQKDDYFVRESAVQSTAASVNWITVNPVFGSVPAGDSLAVAVTVDGQFLPPTYFGSYFKGRLDVELDGSAGIDTIPVPILAFTQDSLHGDTIPLVTASVTTRVTSETNLQRWEYNDMSAAGWLYDGSFLVGRRAAGDTTVYRDVFGNARMWRGRDFWQVDSSWFPEYLIFRDSSMTEDSIFGVTLEAWTPTAGDSADFVYWRVGLYGRIGSYAAITFGLVGDWDLPGSIGVYNLGGIDTTRQMIYQTGNAGFEQFAAGFAQFRAQAHSAVVGSNPDDVYTTGGFEAGKLYQQMATPGFRVDSDNEDLHTILTLDSIASLSPGTLHEYELVLLSSQTGVAGLEIAHARAKQISDSLRYLACPIVMTGDVNMNGTIDAADIIEMVNFVFKSGPPPQPIELAGNVDCTGAVDAADVIYMVNHVFKSAMGPCDACAIY